MCIYRWLGNFFSRLHHRSRFGVWLPRYIYIYIYIYIRNRTAGDDHGHIDLYMYRYIVGEVYTYQNKERITLTHRMLRVFVNVLFWFVVFPNWFFSLFSFGFPNIAFDCYFLMCASRRWSLFIFLHSFRCYLLFVFCIYWCLSFPLPSLCIYIYIYIYI